LIGELSVWRRGQAFSASEQRLLQTFASQGVLALERARLAQVDRRARILEESDRFKSSLLSSVSHELRTPLATIKAAVTSLRAEDVQLDEESYADLLAVIEEETDLLNQLVGNLLNMARIEAGALDPKRHLQALNEIVADARNHMRQQSQRHQFEIDIPEDLPLVPVDYFQIEQVFTNLFSNSIKYSPEGSTICISAAINAGAVQVTVTNQGPPVPDESLERIFDKFYRITAADRVTGAGLGLSICKGIIEAHGGKIWAENLPEGFAFRFTNPLNWKPGTEKSHLQETNQ
jgi:two-component system sensor histidine kinase KdpD